MHRTDLSYIYVLVVAATGAETENLIGPVASCTEAAYAPETFMSAFGELPTSLTRRWNERDCLIKLLVKVNVYDFLAYTWGLQTHCTLAYVLSWSMSR